MSFFKKIERAFDQVVEQAGNLADAGPSHPPAPPDPTYGPQARVAWQSSIEADGRPPFGAPVRVPQNLMLSGPLGGTIAEADVVWRTFPSEIGTGQGFECRLVPTLAQLPAPVVLTITLDPQWSPKNRYLPTNFWNSISLESPQPPPWWPVAGPWKANRGAVNRDADGRLVFEQVAFPRVDLHPAERRRQPLVLLTGFARLT